MSAYFSKHEFWDILEEIETYLGYLKGNELVYEYVHQGDMRAGTEGDWVGLPFSYTGNCPDERFRLRHQMHLVAPEGIDPWTFEQHTKAALDESWDNGVAWASGLRDYCRSVTDQITLPDVYTLRDGLVTLQTQVVSQLEETALDDWAHLGGAESPWTGLAAMSFRELYQNYNDHLTLYGFYQGYATMAFAMAGAAVAHFQAALIPFVRDIRDHLESELEQWVFSKHGPPATLPTWMVTTGEIAGEVFTVVSGANKAVDALGKIVGRVEAALSIMDTVSPKGEEKAFPFASAEAIYTQLTDTLYQDYYQGLRTILDDLASGAETGDVELGGDLDGETFSSDAISGRLDDTSGDVWFMPELGGASDLNNDPQDYQDAYY